MLIIRIDNLQCLILIVFTEIKGRPRQNNLLESLRMHPLSSAQIFHKALFSVLISVSWPFPST